MCTTTCCFNFRGAVRTTEDPHPLLGVQHRSVAVPGSWDIVSSDWLPSSSLTLLQGTSNGAGAREDQVTRSWKNIKSTGWTKHVRNLHDFVRLACFGSLDMLRTSSTTFGWKTTIPKASQQPPQFKFMNPNSEVCNSKPNTLLESVTKINPHPGHISFDQTIRCPQCLDIKVVQVIQEATLKPTARCNGVYTIATIPSSDHCKSGLYAFLPVVPHKAAAEVSKIGNL